MTTSIRDAKITLPIAMAVLHCARRSWHDVHSECMSTFGNRDQVLGKEWNNIVVARVERLQMWTELVDTIESEVRRLLRLKEFSSPTGLEIIVYTRGARLLFEQLVMDSAESMPTTDTVYKLIPHLKPSPANDFTKVHLKHGHAAYFLALSYAEAFSDMANDDRVNDFLTDAVWGSHDSLARQSPWLLAAELTEGFSLDPEAEVDSAGRIMVRKFQVDECFSEPVSEHLDSSGEYGIRSIEVEAWCGAHECALFEVLGDRDALTVSEHADIQRGVRVFLNETRWACPQSDIDACQSRWGVVVHKKPKPKPTKEA